jgi:hypothetical protein
MPTAETSATASAIYDRLVAKADFIESTTDRMAEELKAEPSKEVLEWSTIRRRKFVDAASRDPHPDKRCWTAFGEFERVVLALVKSSPWDRDGLAPELVDETEHLKRLMEQDTGLRDPRWEIRETIDQIDDLFRTMVRRIERQNIDDPRIASRWIVTQLYPHTGEGLTQLIGVDERGLMRFAESGERPAGLNPKRLVLVAQLIYDLRDSRDEEGILLWFSTPRYQLADRTALQLLAEDVDSASMPLRSLARGARGQLAT